MTTNELFNHITKEKGWHIGFCADSTANVWKHRHSKGKLTDDAYKRMFGHFGYRKTDEWVKV